MIELTEAKLDQIRSISRHRAVVRGKLEEIRLAKARGIDTVHIKFMDGDKCVEMSQGDRGGLAKDLAYAFEQHLEEKDESLTRELEELGVRVS